MTFESGKKEVKLRQDCKNNLIFDIYRLVLTDKEPTLSPKLATVESYLSRDVLVEEVEKKLSILMRSREIDVDEKEDLSIFFDNKQMEKKKLFYSDHRISFPCHFKVVVFSCHCQKEVSSSTLH